MRAEDIGFSIETIGVEGIDGLRKVARFSCTKCDATLDINYPIGRILNPERVAKKAISTGWRADTNRKNITLCPQCLNPNRKEKPVSVTPLKPPDVPAPTADQRARIRNFLDKHFDDSVGIYLDDMNDQKIAEAVDLPRIVVERIRESAYGAIKVDPEITSLRNEIAGLKREIVTHQTWVDGTKTKIQSMEDRISKLLSGRAA